jgi:hypothetical protein
MQILKKNLDSFTSVMNATSRSLKKVLPKKQLKANIHVMETQQAAMHEINTGLMTAMENNKLLKSTCLDFRWIGHCVG